MSKKRKPFRQPPQRLSRFFFDTHWAIRVALGLAVIVLAVVLAYLPALTGGFVLDDGFLITNNELVNAPDGLYRMWFTTQSPDYWPATNSMFWIQRRLWGASTVGYHASNVLLHIVACVLVWINLRRLSIAGGVLAAVIFAVHPVNVESVAWISQCKNTLSMVFLLLSTVWFLNWETPSSRSSSAAETSGGLVKGRHCYLLSLSAFLLAMLSKGSVVMLPVLLLTIIRWKRNFRRGDFLCIAPFFAVAIALGAVNVWFQTHGVEAASQASGFTERLLGAGGVVCFYLYKAILPIDLMFVYPQWRVNVGSVLWWAPLATVLGVTMILWRYRNAWGRPILFAWFFFCTALAPVMGFTDTSFMRFSHVADHYQHLAILAVIALAGAGFGVWIDCGDKFPRRAAMVVAAMVVGVLIILAGQQSRSYKDARTLYETTLRQDPNSPFARNLLGIALLDAGQYEDAIEECRKAIGVKPDYVEAYFTLGDIYARMRQYSAAIENYEQVLELDPSSLQAHFNLAGVFKEQGEYDKAVEYYGTVIDSYPQYEPAYVNLGIVFLQMNQVEESLEQFRQAARIAPNSPEAQQDMGLVLLMLGRPDEAIVRLQRAIELKPDFYEAFYNLGNSYRAKGQFREAIGSFERALALNSQSFQAQNRIGAVFSEMGQMQEAIEHYRRAVLLKPDYFEALRNLGSALLKTGRFQEATVEYGRAVQLEPSSAETWCDMATAFAGAKESSQAIGAGEKAMELAKLQNRVELADKIEKWLRSYRLSLKSAPD
jgi:protein O-mannosyl-transferase